MPYPSYTSAISGAIGTTNSADKYATHIDFLGRGGYRSVTDQSALTAITENRRSNGMLVRVHNYNGLGEKYFVYINPDYSDTTDVLNTNASNYNTVYLIGNPNYDTATRGFKEIKLGGSSLPDTGSLETNKIYYLKNSYAAGIWSQSWNELGFSDISGLTDALNGKENTITAGSTGQYYRGDKTFQTLDKSAVGLGNVDNTSDANKPISTLTQTALNGKEPSITKLPINKGGTNSNTALNNARIMISLGDAIIEQSAIAGSKVLITDDQGLPIAGVNSSVLTNIPANTNTALDLKLNITATSVTSGSNITLNFSDSDTVYGTTTPITGTITINTTGAKIGVTHIVIHNAASLNITGTATKLSGSGNYKPSSVNYIYFTFVGSTVIYSINQGV